MIETRSFCGTLLLELVEGEVDDAKSALASALVDVRSLKLDYRTEYRGMLRRLSNEMAGLVADSVSTDRPIRWTPSAVRQLVTGSPRREVPASHPLRTELGLESIAGRVMVQRRSRDLDTLENRFVKFVMEDFRTFLTHAQGIFESSKGWGASAALSRRLAATVEDWLGRGMFLEVGQMSFAPLGSPVLQRKAGYREVLRWWLRFRTAAELSWEGGEELFRAGQRDVASLYEYWLFFELLEWFCKKCRGGERPAVEELIDGLEEGSPNLRLKMRTELGPFTGTFGKTSRQLQARFSYNKSFQVTNERELGGSWTRRLHPDYTLTFWPAGLSEAAAERDELLIHVHRLGVVIANSTTRAVPGATRTTTTGSTVVCAC